MPTNCWKTDEHDADEDDQAAEGKHFAGVMFAERGADFGELFFAFLFGDEPGQDGARAGSHRLSA